MTTSTKKPQSTYRIASIIHHITVSGTVVAATFTAFIIFITSFLWSINISGSDRYAILIFSRMNPEITIITFVLIVLFTIMPFISGSTVSGLFSVDIASKKFKEYWWILLLLLLVPSLGLSCFFVFLSKSKLWAIIGFFLMTAIFSLIIAFWSKKDKVISFNFLMQIFAFYAVTIVGTFNGMLVFFAELINSTLNHSTGKYEELSIIFAILFIIFLALFVGIISGSILYKSLISFAIITTTLSILLIYFHVPQNIIIELNGGVTKVPEQLKSAITRAGGPSITASCNKTPMHVLKLHDKTIFSYMENKKEHIYGTILSNENYNTLYDFMAKYPSKPFVYKFNCIKHKKEYVCQKYIALAGKKPACNSKDSTLPQTTNAHTGS